jgi:hypothetical protein
LCLNGANHRGSWRDREAPIKAGVVTWPHSILADKEGSPEQARGLTMAATTRNRIERVETEQSFRIWVRRKRFLESLSIDELEMWTAARQFISVP